MRKIILGLLLVFLTPIISPKLVHAQVNNFYISEYEVHYQLSRDGENHSFLNTTETITAQFPEINQNHGLERAIPSSYDGHSTDLAISSVKDESGNSLEYSTYNDNDNLVLRIGNKNSFVHGSKTYVINYSQRDVTKFFSNTGRDEFYWDTNGTEWSVPINNLSVTLDVDESISKNLTGNNSCYFGEEGSSDKCNLQSSDNSFFVTEINLKPGQNVTLAIGFQPNTFVGYTPTLIEKLFVIWVMVQTILFIVSIILFIWLTVRFLRQKNRTKEHNPIVAEYLPPPNASVQISSLLMRSNHGFTAQVIDLAVRHYIGIIQTKEKKSIFSNNEYELEIIRSVDDLRPEEIEILTDMFGTKPNLGDVLSLQDLKKDTKFQTRLMDNPKKLKELTRNQYGLRKKDPVKSAWFKRFGYISLVVSFLTLSPSLLVIAILAFVYSFSLYPLTDSGLALMRYLKGLKNYISVAEEERLKMLQSPEGATKTKISGSDEKQLVKLYERVLPYAVLFGQEKDWNKQLGKYYEASGTQPDWYRGPNGALFNAAVFSSAMNSFSTAATYAAPTSSSSGGSSGGGFSGGGGGGGGGGGW